MKKRVLIALVVVLALAATASVVWAGKGGPNGTLLTWSTGSAWYLRTGSGLVHQWDPNQQVHVVLKPLSHFPDAPLEPCETDEGTIFGSGFWYYDGTFFDDDTVANTIYTPDETYFYCVYEWQWPE